MIKLTLLEPRWMRYEERGGGIFMPYVEKIEDAQGIWFMCPGCYLLHRGTGRGVHGVICWSRSRGVPDHARPGPGRWKLIGSSFSDLSLKADPPSAQSSVQLHGGCKWHGHVTNGEAG